MPRIKALSQNYIESDLKKFIRGQMAMAGITQKDIGKATMQTQQAVSHKIKNGTLSAKELIVIFHLCQTSDEDILKIIKY